MCQAFGQVQTFLPLILNLILSERTSETQSSQQPCEGHSIPVLQLRKWDGMEGKSLAQGQAATKKQNQNSNPYLLAPKSAMALLFTFQKHPKWWRQHTHLSLHLSPLCSFPSWKLTGGGGAVKPHQVTTAYVWGGLISTPPQTHALHRSSSPAQVSKPFFKWGCKTNKGHGSRIPSPVPHMLHSPPAPGSCSQRNGMSQ